MESSRTARGWWGKWRLIYNAGLVVAGMASLTLQAALLEFSNCQADETNLNPLALVYRAAGYLAAMGLANLLYSLGPVVETRLHPVSPHRFRLWTFTLGMTVSCALPFFAPLLFLARCR